MKALLGLLLAGCVTDKTEETGEVQESTPPDDSGEPTGESGESGEGEESGETAHSAEPEGWPLSTCDSPVSWTEGGGGTGVRDLAADFTLPTSRGDWVFSERWSGCESYLFLVWQRGGDSSDLWTSDLDDFLTRAPTDLQVFFLSAQGDEADALADVTDMEARVEEALAALDPELAAAWEGRFHFVPTLVSALDGWIPLMADQSWSSETFAIDRAQRLRSTGMLHSASRSAPTFKYLANEPIYYAFEAEREIALEASGATVIPVWDSVEMGDPGWAGVSTTADVELPDAATMAGFDTLTLDLSMDCAEHLDENCPPWDYLVNLYLCDADDPDTCDTEIGRFVTTYWREGRYVVDASPYLALLQEGGSRRLRFYTTQTYLVSLDLRLSNSGSGLVAAAAQYLWSGASFNESYNDLFSPITFEVPSDAKKVELVATISGHGWGGDTENCAEFCNHTHHFVVEGDEYSLEHPEAGSADGCMEQVSSGTVPNQYGTWYYGRGGWCPGREVSPWRQDITASVTLGAENEISYSALLGAEEYVPEYIEGESFWANIQMTSWIVVWK